MSAFFFEIIFISHTPQHLLLSRKNPWLPPFFFLDSKSFCKDLLYPHGANLAQKPPYLVGAVLNRRVRLNSFVLLDKGSLSFVTKSNIFDKDLMPTKKL